jgi:hypothetical protein
VDLPKVNEPERRVMLSMPRLRGMGRISKSASKPIEVKFMVSDASHCFTIIGDKNLSTAWENRVIYHYMVTISWSALGREVLRSSDDYVADTTAIVGQVPIDAQHKIKVHLPDRRMFPFPTRRHSRR